MEKSIPAWQQSHSSLSLLILPSTHPDLSPISCNSRIQGEIPTSPSEVTSQEVRAWNAFETTKKIMEKKSVCARGKATGQAGEAHSSSGIHRLLQSFQRGSVDSFGIHPLWKSLSPAVSPVSAVLLPLTSLQLRSSVRFPDHPE